MATTSFSVFGRLTAESAWPSVQTFQAAGATQVAGASDGGHGEATPETDESTTPVAKKAAGKKLKSGSTKTKTTTAMSSTTLPVATAMKKAKAAADGNGKKTTKTTKTKKANVESGATRASAKTPVKRPAAGLGSVGDGQVFVGGGLGCSKCRWGEGGCVQCRNPSYRPRHRHLGLATTTAETDPAPAANLGIQKQVDDADDV